MIVRWLGMAEIVIFILILSVLLYYYYTHQEARRKTARRAFDIDWDAANDERVRSLLPDWQINAIKEYRELAGVDLRTAKAVIDHLVANPDDYGDEDRKKSAPRDAGIRDLVRQGRISEAVAIYREFTGLSNEEAAEDIAQIEQELALADLAEETDASQDAASH